MFAETISYPAALLAGLLSFFSPCILPLIPAYFVFISGFTLDELTGCENGIRKKVVLSTIAYVLGFSSVFILMGASASYLGSFIQIYSTAIRIIGGVLIMFLGLHLTGWLRFNALEFEKRVHLDKKPIHFMGTFLVGMAFGAGWSPCIGPLLGSILIIAGSKETVHGRDRTLKRLFIGAGHSVYGHVHVHRRHAGVFKKSNTGIEIFQSNRRYSLDFGGTVACTE